VALPMRDRAVTVLTMVARLAGVAHALECCYMNTSCALLVAAGVV
jgi:hypothetical protein